MTKSKPSDVLSRMKAAASREKPVTTAEEPEVTPDISSSGSTPVQPPRVRKIRYTLDLEPGQHKNLKRFAVEADADASEVMRALLVLLYTDTQVRNAVLTAISKD